MKRHVILACSIILAAAIFLPLCQNARKIRTRLPLTKERLTEEDLQRDQAHAVIMRCDTSQLWKDTEKAIRFYGFDKTAGSSVESFFIVNGLDSMISRIGLDIMYLDMKGRELHRRDCVIDCKLPPKETRRVDIKTWDIQKSFYFHQSAKPKRQSTPFDVRIELKSVEF